MFLICQVIIVFTFHKLVLMKYIIYVYFTSYCALYVLMRFSKSCNVYLHILYIAQSLVYLWIVQLSPRGCLQFWVFWRPQPVVLSRFYITGVFVSPTNVHEWTYRWNMETTMMFHSRVTAEEYSIFCNVNCKIQQHNCHFGS